MTQLVIMAGIAVAVFGTAYYQSYQENKKRNRYFPKKKPPENK